MIEMEYIWANDCFIWTGISTVTDWSYWRAEEEDLLTKAHVGSKLELWYYLSKEEKVLLRAILPLTEEKTAVMRSTVRAVEKVANKVVLFSRERKVRLDRESLLIWEL